MINIIIFSKDRACQLELLIRSMKFYWEDISKYKINILYKYSSDFFKEGYDKLKSMYKNINWMLENNFKNDLLSLIDTNNQYTIFFVDDQVFKEPFNMNDIPDYSYDILCVSLRLHPNLTYCYAANIPMNKLNSTKFRWRYETGDFSYPMSLDSHIFLTEDIYPLLCKLNYINPNSLESNLAFNPIKKDFMVCFEKSKTINNPCNKVQTNNPNRHGDITADYLNEMFLKGFIIDLKDFKNIENESCHKEIEINFIKNN